jgi:hypothetical protein
MQASSILSSVIRYGVSAVYSAMGSMQLGHRRHVQRMRPVLKSIFCRTRHRKHAASHAPFQPIIVSLAFSLQLSWTGCLTPVTASGTRCASAPSMGRAHKRHVGGESAFEAGAADGQALGPGVVGTSASSLSESDSVVSLA